MDKTKSNWDILEDVSGWLPIGGICGICGNSTYNCICRVQRDSKAEEELSKIIKEAALGVEDKKYDQGKAMVGLMKRDFSKALAYVAEVTSYGVKKYNQPGSWRQVENALVRYEDALGRHDLAMCYEDIDEESKLLHAGHRAWNALATLELILEKSNEDM